MSSSMTLSRVVEHAKPRKLRNETNNVVSNHQLPLSNPSVHNSSHLQHSRLCKNSSLNEPGESLIVRKPKKMFFSATFLGLGCKGASMPDTAPTIVRSATDWKPEKRRNRKGRKAHVRARTATNVDICCAPPGITFACDVVPSTSPRHVPQSRVARRSGNISCVPASSSQGLSSSIFSRAHTSSARQYHHLNHRHSLRGNSEANAIPRRSLHEGDQYRSWRHNLDSMLYEELVELSEKIGHASKGLREEEIISCLRIFKPTDFESPPLLISIDKEWRCSICQEGCQATDSLGRLSCGHCHHINCIKHWLRLKNECPVCKTAPIADK